MGNDSKVSKYIFQPHDCYMYKTEPRFEGFSERGGMFDG